MRTIRVTGQLVTMEMLARACNKVSQAHAATADKGPDVLVVVNGAVLGRVPSLVWQLVQERIEALLPGEVTIETSDERPPTPTPGFRPPSVTPGGRLRRRRRVLVASHVAHFRAQLLAAFSDAGFEAVGVADGAQAEKQLTSRPTHVLVADFELPKRAGDELLARAWTQHPALHVTALVAAELPHMLVPPHDAADLVRGQPLDVPDLVARVRALLDTRSSMR